jgi:ferric-dicitrate binding protein FerR (iron transport regulator)
MSPLHERLSRLLDGELSPDEAQALRAQIDTDPEVARAWSELLGLVAELESLPTELAVPLKLDQRVLAEPVASPSHTGFAVGGWLVAAAALLVALLSGSQDAERVLASGTEWVDGEVLLLAGDAVVRLDGRARIDVEPPSGFAREGTSEEAMDRTHLIAALAGSAVTVTVFAGTASVWPNGDTTSTPIIVREGQLHQTRSVQPKVPEHTDRMADVASGPALAELTAEMEELKRQNAELRKALETEGTADTTPLEEPIAFPDELVTGLRPDAFEATMEAVLEGYPSLAFVEVDCSEYPCIAYLQPADGEPLDKALMHDITGDLIDELQLEGGAGMMASIVEREDDQGQRMSVLALGPFSSETTDSLRLSESFHSRTAASSDDRERAP